MKEWNHSDNFELISIIVPKQPPFFFPQFQKKLFDENIIFVRVSLFLSVCVCVMSKMRLEEEGGNCSSPLLFSSFVPQLLQLSIIQI
jgi:hypothetical protein